MPISSLLCIGATQRFLPLGFRHCPSATIGIDSMSLVASCVGQELELEPELELESPELTDAALLRSSMAPGLGYPLLD